MSTYSDTVLQDVPTLFWRCGEASGNLTDSSGNSRTGTATGTPTYSVAGALTGDADTAITVNGSSQYVASTYSAFTVGSIRTFEAWGNRTNHATLDVLFGGTGGAASPPGLRLNTDQSVTWALNGGAVADSWAIGAWPGDGQWVHTVLIWNDTTFVGELFINGVSQGAKAALASGYAANSGNFKIGAWFTTSDAFVGSIDEVAVYGAALSPARIAHHYNVGKGRIGVPKRRLIRPVSTPLSGAGYR